VALLRPPLAERREDVIDALKARGVGTSVYYPRSLPDTVYYRDRYGYEEGHCPVATRISTTSIAFPVGPHLAVGDVDRIVETVKDAIQEISTQ
jgi:dTDP-4-amino-4,6-dideoxygalactose transaminase